jgi:hypothetical protein
MAAVGGLVAALVVGGGLVWASSGSSQDPDATSAVLTPSGAPRSAQDEPSGTPSPEPPSPTPVVTVTATATATVANPGPVETVYVTPERNDPSSEPAYTSGTTFAGYWSGNLQGDSANYSAVLDLDESISGWVSGTVTLRNSSAGITGVWQTSGTASGNRVVLTPDDWVSRPNSTWERDTVTLTYSGGTLTASFVDPRKPNEVWGRTTLS